ncbi:MAG: M23 family metallopeptidase [Hyphomicrobiales bacterium]|nr:M23 family metallopeptidase [Hyphomicrobiales bacterium]MDE2018251.1 M23 family metallopeptidase [Hyphomicrobiales bacterium]
MSPQQVRPGIAVDLGVDPPIELDGRRHDDAERRRFNARWIVACGLSGAAGAALLAATMYASTGGHIAYAVAPHAATPAAKPDDGPAPIKGDRLVRPVDIVTDKQTFLVPVAVKAVGGQTIEKQSFTRVVSTLTLTRTAYAQEVPPFDPTKFVAGFRFRPPKAGRSAPIANADVTFTTAPVKPGEVDGPVLSDADALAQVDAQAKPRDDGAKPFASPLAALRIAPLSQSVPGALAYAKADALAMPPALKGVNMRMVKVDETDVVPSAPEADPPTQTLVTVKPGETPEKAMAAAGCTLSEAAAAAASLRIAKIAATQGDRLRVRLGPVPGRGGARGLVGVTVYADETPKGAVAIDDAGAFVPVRDLNEPAPGANAAPRPDGLRLYDAVYETALKRRIPKSIIDEAIHAFANVVDFQKPVSPGDTFEAFYANPTGGEGPRSDLLYVALDVGGQTFREYHYVTPDDHALNFYDPLGRSGRSFLVRKPVAAGAETSTFGMRFDPVMHRYQLHSGVDWGAPPGTPIFAAGDGTISFMGRFGGYGNRIEITHSYGYLTTYNHMSAFARGDFKGERVRQGQLIGFVGTTGASTGPHLHFEIKINGNFVDPMGIRLPRVRELGGAILAGFKAEKARIDSLRAKAPSDVALGAATRTAAVN